MATLLASEFKHGIAMKCGCTAHGTLQRKGEPAVVACAVHDCTDVAEVAPDLTGRKARCRYGGNEVASSFSLAFFEHHPNAEHDSYYCGCYGWD
jgi:hypothetical protein